jgi:hypothetical protein
MFEFAKTKLGALRPHADTVFERLESPQIIVRKPQFYTPQELCAILEVQPDVESLIYVGSQAFCGLQPHEARALHDTNIVPRSDGVDPHIEMEEEVGWKDPVTGQIRIRQRFAPITPPFEAILDAVELPAGPLIRSKSIIYKVRRAAKEANLEWRINGLRNSFIVYRLALLDDLSQVAYEAGFVFERDIEIFTGLAEKPAARAFFKVKLDASDLDYTAPQGLWVAALKSRLKTVSAIKRKSR